MPIYAYRCESCGHAQDVLQKISDPLLVTCPACGASSFRKQLTAAGFQLKGSGWYATDFKNGPKPAPAAAAAADAAKPEGGTASPAASPAAAPATPAASPGKDTSSSASGCASSCACH